MGALVTVAVSLLFVVQDSNLLGHARTRAHIPVATLAVFAITASSELLPRFIP